MPWDAKPSDARWYGEVVFSVDGETDYNSGYSADPEPPEVEEIPMPDGAKIIESGVHPVYLGDPMSTLGDV